MNYDLKYYELMLRRNSKTAKQISMLRWNFVSDIAIVKKVLDVGSGCGFFRAYRPCWVKIVDTYDVGDYPQTGIQHKTYDLITLWDVIEHIDWKKDGDKIIEMALQSTETVAISIPIKPRFKRYKKWKHTKENEHLTYFTIRTLDRFFKKRGFIKIKEGWPETDCGIREDIYSAIYQKE